MKGIVLWGILGLIVLLGLLPVGVAFRRRKGEPLFLWLRIGPLRFQLMPEKKKKPPPLAQDQAPPPPAPVPAPQGPAPAETAQEKRAKEKKGRFEKGTDLETVKRAIEIFGPPLWRCLRRLGRSVRLDPLDLTVVLAGARDPAQSAVCYGKLQGALWSLMPQLERIIHIPHPHLRIEVDFDREKTDFRGRAGVSVRVGTLLGIVLSMAVPAVRWVRGRKKSAAGKEDSNGHGKERSAA